MTSYIYICIYINGKRDQLQNLCALCSSVVQQSRASGADAQTVSIQAQSLGYEVEHLQHEGRRGGCANGLLPDSVGYEVESLRVEGVRDGCANSRSQGPTIGWEVKQFEGWGSAWMRKLFVSRLSSLGYSRASQAQIILSFVPSSTKSLCSVVCASRSTKLGDLAS